MRFFSTSAIFWILCLFTASAEEVGGHHALPLHAERIFADLPITNSMIMTWVAALIVILFAKMATRQMKAVPTGLQNLAEWLVESLYKFLEGILGTHLVKRTFWFFGGVFILILLTNWIGLLPGVGTFGWETAENGHTSFTPWLRGGNADLNMTAALSLIFTGLWFYWAVSENGVVGFLKHIFAPKGHFSGFMKIFMIVIF